MALNPILHQQVFVKSWDTFCTSKYLTYLSHFTCFLHPSITEVIIYLIFCNLIFPHRLELLKGQEEFEEEGVYFQEIQEICFGSDPKKNGEDPDR